MASNLNHNKNMPDSSAKKWLPAWFKVCVVVLLGLIILKSLGLQVFIEINFAGRPFIASLTEIEIYYIPLGLLLVYLVAVWIWNTFFKSKDV